MTARMDALIRFREAVDVGEVDAALQAARDAGGLATLADSLALVLVLAGNDGRERYDTAVGRWLLRLQEAVPLPWSDRERCARALGALGECRAAAVALDELASVLLAHGQPAAAEEVEMYRVRAG